MELDILKEKIKEIITENSYIVYAVEEGRVIPDNYLDELADEIIELFKGCVK